MAVDETRASGVRKVTLAYVFGPRNAGDMALNIGAMDLLSDLGTAEVTGVSRFAVDSPSYESTRRYLEPLYPNLRLLPFPVSFDRHTQGRFGQLASFAAGSLHLLGLRKSAMSRAVEQADFLLFNGGNLMFARGPADLPRLAAMLFPSRLAEKAGVPIGFLPQSIPVLDYAPARRWVEAAFRRARFTFFRERDAMDLVDLSGVSHARHVPDLAFFMSHSDDEGAERLLEETGLEAGSFCPILPRATTLGDQGGLSADKVEETITLVRRSAEAVLEHGLEPCLVIQTEADREIVATCRESLRDLAEVPQVEHYDPLVLRSFYEKAAAMVTFRLHAAIFAMSVGTLPVGFYRRTWGRKLPGVFESMGISSNCVDVEEEPDRVTTVLKDTLGRSDVRAKARTALLERVERLRSQALGWLQEAWGP